MRKVNRTVAVHAIESSKTSSPTVSLTVDEHLRTGCIPEATITPFFPLLEKLPSFGRPCIAALFPRSCLERSSPHKLALITAPMLPKDSSQRFIRQSGSYMSRTCKCAGIYTHTHCIFSNFMDKFVWEILRCSYRVGFSFSLLSLSINAKI